MVAVGRRAVSVCACVRVWFFGCCLFRSLTHLSPFPPTHLGASGGGHGLIPCQTRLVEVKGPNDSLSEHQKAWIRDAFARMRVARQGEGAALVGGEVEEDGSQDGYATTPDTQEEEAQAARRRVARRYPMFELARVEVVESEDGGGGKRQRKG